MKSTFGHSPRTNQRGWEIPLNRGLLPGGWTIIFCQRSRFYHRRESLRDGSAEIASVLCLFYGGLRRNSTKRKKTALQLDAMTSGGAFVV
eukprot:scaffold3369_cov66-Skeletonema_marinoi.AAC.2